MGQIKTESVAMTGQLDNGDTYKILPPTSIAAQTWWAELHRIIIAAFLHRPPHITAYPPDWTRLHEDPATAAQGLASELGDQGSLIVLLQGDKPVACTGILPHRERGAASSNSIGNGDTPAMKVCCFCVSLQHRGQGLSYRLLEMMEAFTLAHGAKQLYASYAEIETGDFWLHMGFEVVPGAGSVLRKGFKIDVEKEGLREDVVFTMAVKRFGGEG